MIQLIFILEDTRIDAIRDTVKIGEWCVKVTDLPTNENIERVMSDVQIGSVVALALGVGEDSENPVSDSTLQELYSVCEEQFKGVELKFRPIP